VERAAPLPAGPGSLQLVLLIHLSESIPFRIGAAKPTDPSARGGRQAEPKLKPSEAQAHSP
jgi:hypothetical protein